MCEQMPQIRSSRYRSCDPVARSRRAFLDAAMDVAQADRRAGDDLAVDGELEMPGFFQRRVLRPDRDDELLALLVSVHRVLLVQSLSRLRQPLNDLRSGYTPSGQSSGRNSRSRVGRAFTTMPPNISHQLALVERGRRDRRRRCSAPARS